MRRVIKCVVILAVLVGAGTRASEKQLQVNTNYLYDMRVVSTPKQFLVTPRWSPTESGLLLSGKNGVGLFFLNTKDLILQELVADYKGAALWAADGQSVLTQQELYKQGRIILFENEHTQVAHEDYYGQIFVTTNGKTKILAQEAWGVTISPNGKYIAFCLGHLISSQLTVMKLDGQSIYTGPGTHPAWLPQSDRLIYTVPEPQLTAQGGIKLSGAELYLLDIHKSQSTQLTFSQDTIEMQPAVSPSGTQLAFSDWISGSLVLIRLANQGGEQ